MGLAILIRILTSYEQVRRIPAYRILVGSFISFLVATIATILESFFLQFFLNILEHLFYLFSQVLMTVWVWKNCKTGEGGIETQ